jgi:hypothetical protein
LLHERASWFFNLLEQAFKLSAEEHLEDIQIVCAPSMKEEHLNRMIESYKRRSRDIIDTIDTPDTFLTTAQLKEKGIL